MTVSQTEKKVTIFRQICELIPPFLVAKLATQYNVKSRKITPWSHVVSMLYAQFSHAIGLNDVCDALKANLSNMISIRGARPPSRNGLSHANKTRTGKMAKDLFWAMRDHLEGLKPGFGCERFGKLPRRFKRTVHAMDSSTIKLVANCMDWAKHRRRKAAAKLHLILNLENFLPSCAIVDSAKGHDNKKAYSLCAGLKPGEIAVFDMAYIDYAHLFLLSQRDVFWVSRVKENMKFRCVEKRLKNPHGNILRDDIVILENNLKREAYPERLRRVTAIVTVDQKEMEMTFFTNNMEWAASSICDLYKSRWNIEVFFKQIKQTLKLGGFLGNSRNSIEWQIWTALLVYILLRFLHNCCHWGHSFIRLFTALRAVLWQRRIIMEYLNSYGTAGGSFKMIWAPHQAFLPGFA